MRTIIFPLLLITVFATAVFANVRPPSTPVPKQVKGEMTGRIYIDLRSDVKVPTLKIRREALKQLRAAIDEADDSQNAVASTGDLPGYSRLQTIVGGALFSLAFVFGGVWLMRSKSTPSRLAMSLLVFAGFGLGAIVVFGNSPPPSVVGLTTRIFDKHTKTYGYAAGNLKIQVLDRKPGVFTGSDQDDVILEIPNGGEDKDAE